MRTVSSCPSTHRRGRADALRGVRDGALKVSVTQAPEKGKANKAIVWRFCATSCH